jgi:hypothetical protein
VIARRDLALFDAIMDRKKPSDISEYINPGLCLGNSQDGEED